MRKAQGSSRYTVEDDIEDAKEKSRTAVVVGVMWKT
jgi:hypothetical protein